MNDKDFFPFIPESDGNSNMTKHVAAWDLPSLDYLSEEQTLKYLRKHEEDVQRREQKQQGRLDAISMIR